LETVPYKIREGSFKLVEKISNLAPNDFFSSITVFNESEEELNDIVEINLDTCKNPFGFKLLNPFTFKGKQLEVLLTAKPKQTTTLLIHKTNKFEAKKTELVYKAKY